MAGQRGQQQQEGFRRKGEEPVDAGRADSTLTVPWKLSRAQLSKAFPFPKSGKTNGSKIYLFVLIYLPELQLALCLCGACLFEW